MLFTVFNFGRSLWPSILFLRAQQSTAAKPAVAPTSNSAADPVKNDATDDQQSSTVTSSNGLTGGNINTTA